LPCNCGRICPTDIGGLSMILAIILICCLPAGMILLVFFAIGSAGAKTFRKGKRAYADFKPYINNLSDQVAKAQEKGMSFSDRGQKLAENVQEIQGRWAFITESVSEIMNSPAARVADMAGRFASKRS
jgi:hypothetical protein